MELPASLPSFAPLNSSWLLHIARYRLRQPQQAVTPFGETRARATGQIIEVVQQKSLTTTTLSSTLALISPSGPEPDRDLLWRWKRKGVIRYIDEHPCLHSSIALLLGRYLHRAPKGWCPSSISPQEPLFWCWVELPGSSTRYMAAYPFDDTVYLDLPSNDPTSLHTLPTPAVVHNLPSSTNLELEPGWYQLPPAAIVYSAYTGLAYRQDGSLDSHWLAVNGGVIRFWQNQAVSLTDLISWKQEIVRLDLLPEELIPDVVQTARILTLQLLASQRIPVERQSVPWYTPE